METKYFGTDGVRGEANKTLTVEMAYRIGRYLGAHYKQENILIGRDTRKSGIMFEAALVSGLTESGANVDLLGVCPTPSVAYLTRVKNYKVGVMISASHNPYYDNGIKLFNENGEKMNPEFEKKIEEYIDAAFELETAERAEIGIARNISHQLREYLDFLKDVVSLELTGMKVVLDLANGSATTTSAMLFEELGAEVISIFSEPDGVNINLNCGSTHPETFCARVKESGAHIGFAFDGDADRVMACDEKGNLIDGDKILYLCGQFMKDTNTLKKDTIVTTVMANIGLYKALETLDIMTEKTQVGDKYVYECMKEEDYNLGGEQSGHIIFRDYATTGDGLLTALKVMEVVMHYQKPVSELLEKVFIYPQLLINKKVIDKKKVLDDAEIGALVDEIGEELGDAGRILVRPSGTEPLIRVMVEAKTDEFCEHYVNKVITLIEEKGM